jgi:hypothetical protein
MAMAPGGDMATAPGGDMASGPACPSSPQPFAAGMALSYTSDADWIYGFDEQSAIVRVPRSGGAAEPLVAGAGADSGNLLVDDQYVFWVFGTFGSRELRRAPKSGGSFTAIYVGLLSSAVVMDADRLYFMSASNILTSVPKDGGAPTHFGETAADGIWMAGVDGQYVHYVTIDDRQPELTFTFNRVRKTGGPEEVLATLGSAGRGYPRPLTDESYIFAWFGDEIVRVSKSDGALDVIHDSQGYQLVSAALDAGHLYWIASDDLSNRWLLTRADKSGGDVTTLVDTLTPIRQGITLTGDSVYYSSPEIWRLCR